MCERERGGKLRPWGSLIEVADVGVSGGVPPKESPSPVSVGSDR